MSDHTMSRRTVLLGAAAAMAAVPMRLKAASGPAIHVLRDPGCGCCGAWMEVLQRDGFEVTSDEVENDVLAAAKLSRGVPEEMMSCHTGDVEGYVIEGHVPPADIRRLLAERPDAVGLTVPGMPYGSPGMGPEDQREAYAVHLIRRDGTTEIFTQYDAAA